MPDTYVKLTEKASVSSVISDAKMLIREAINSVDSLRWAPMPTSQFSCSFTEASDGTCTVTGITGFMPDDITAKGPGNVTCLLIGPTSNTSLRFGGTDALTFLTFVGDGYVLNLSFLSSAPASGYYYTTTLGGNTVYVTGVLSHTAPPEVIATGDILFDTRNANPTATLSNMSLTYEEVADIVESGRGIVIRLNGHSPYYTMATQLSVTDMSQSGGKWSQFFSNYVSPSVSTLSDSLDGKCYFYDAQNDRYILTDYNDSVNAYSYNYDWQNDSKIDSSLPYYVGITLDTTNNTVTVWSDVDMSGVDLDLYADQGADAVFDIAYKGYTPLQVGNVSFGVYAFEGKYMDVMSGVIFDILVSVMHAPGFAEYWQTAVYPDGSPITVTGELNILNFAVSNLSRDFPAMLSAARCGRAVEIRLSYNTGLDEEEIIGRLSVVGKTGEYLTFDALFYADIGQGLHPYLVQGLWTSSGMTLTPVQLATESQIPAASMNSQTGVLSID